MNSSAQGASEGGTAGREHLGATESAAASRHWWDTDAANYLAEHGETLAGDLLWGPEGLAEAEAGLLGSVHGQRVLEVGCGAAQGGRWLAGKGAQVVGLDVSHGMLAAGRDLDNTSAHPVERFVQASGHALPFADSTFDRVVSAHGAYAFMADLVTALREASRVLVPGGILVFSVTHPIRWAFIDSPDADGLVAVLSYFDRTPYVERDVSGRPTYVEHHRTLGDTVSALISAGFTIEQLVEPEWPEWNERTWGPWSPLRGELIPGTAIWRARKPRPMTQ